MGKFGHQTFTRIRLKGGTGSYILSPVLTTTQRDALTAAEGMLIFNSTTDQLEEYDGSTWEAAGQVIMTTHEADLDAHTKNPLEVLIVGEYVTGYSVGGAASNLAIIDDYLFVVPFIASRDMTIDRIAVDVQTGEVDADARLGIYNDNGAMHPGTLLVDGGAVDLDTAAVQAVTVDQALVKGIYWMAVLCNTPGGTAKLYKYATYFCLGIGAADFTQIRGCYYKSSVAYGALPDPAPTMTINHSYQFMVLPRIASLD